MQALSFGAGGFAEVGTEVVAAASIAVGALRESLATCGAGLEVGTSGLPHEAKKKIPLKTKTSDKRAIVPRFK